MTGAPTAHPPDGSQRKMPRGGRKPPRAGALIIRICTECLRPFVNHVQSCAECGDFVRELVTPLKFYEFDRLTEEKLEELPTRMIPKPAKPAAARFKPGDRVRYLPVPSLTGRIVRRYRGKHGDWLVAWETGNTCSAVEANLELVGAEVAC